MPVEVLRCPACGAVISDSTRRCEYCGSELEIVQTPAGCEVTSKESSSTESSSTESSAGSDRPLADDPDWVIVASFASVNDWHSASEALNHANIVARDVDDPADPAASALAVLGNQALAAHRVLAELSGGSAPNTSKMPRG
jgi:zinc-ribbon domain